MRTIAAGRFKATCLAVMDEVNSKREPVLITKNGKPIAQLIPPGQEADPLAIFRFPGVEMQGDIVSPVTELEDWDALR